MVPLTSRPFEYQQSRGLSHVSTISPLLKHTLMRSNAPLQPGPVPPASDNAPGSHKHVAEIQKMGDCSKTTKKRNMHEQSCTKVNVAFALQTRTLLQPTLLLQSLSSFRIEWPPTLAGGTSRRRHWASKNLHSSTLALALSAQIEKWNGTANISAYLARSMRQELTFSSTLAAWAPTGPEHPPNARSERKLHGTMKEN